jgi:hypothetical protein
MQFSDIVMIYVIVGVVLFIGTGGAVGGGADGPISKMFNVGPEEVTADEAVTSEESQSSQGMLDNLLGPLQEGAGSVFGGGLIGAVSAFVLSMLTILTWPMQVAFSVGAPVEVQLVAGVFMAGMAMGAGKVLRASL